MTAKSLETTAIELVDAVVELYLGSVIKPFLKLHETFYNSLNQFIRSILDNNKKNIPIWFSANCITYVRTIMVIPTLLLFAWGHVILPSIIVICVDFGDFLDGVVARYWVDVRKEQAKTAESKDKRSASPTLSDHDSFGAYMIMFYLLLHRILTY
jgi:hypothetical protein